MNELDISSWEGLLILTRGKNTTQICSHAERKESEERTELKIKKKQSLPAQTRHQQSQDGGSKQRLFVQTIPQEGGQRWRQARLASKAALGLWKQNTRNSQGNGEENMALWTMLQNF